MEAQLVNEFVNRTGASSSDALACLSTWGFDLKRALTDYNGECSLHIFATRYRSLTRSRSSRCRHFHKRLPEQHRPR